MFLDFFFLLIYGWCKVLCQNSFGKAVFRGPVGPPGALTIDIEYNKRLDRQQPCLEDDFNGGSSNIVQSNKSV